MKILSASLFIALGLAIGTTLSALATGPAEGGQVIPEAVNDYAAVGEHEAVAGMDDARR